ncbi:hypothetical protein GY21_17965 [Cryobacterium roopkundense]|uniref:Uncharacterized protein YndB with AHSA1/START domain n=1 Tax=Cryobacterium roopkundense TaxID=1001240 RepID=A0A099J3H3_9MICO|nr:SRPBCC domain-containing protein [Cryobacterium roopkundense]KGJ72057.1 hypothetical protein GY21_17965 [Cryobacterium roopkundense]MBB5640673.1 uncharacterized protein YndB with AHSA1/START domain [Cryobacterium roopkundense]
MTAGITVTRRFAASPDRAYALWTDPEQFSVWFGTEAVSVPLDTLVLDVRVGGVWSAVMHLPDGTTIQWLGEYTEVVPPQRLAFTMTDDPANPAREPVTVDVTAVDGGAEMTLVQTGGHLSEEQYAQTVIGYNAFFDAMETVLVARN